MKHPPPGGSTDVKKPTDPPAKTVVADLIGTGTDKPEDTEDSEDSPESTPETITLEKRLIQLEKKVEKTDRDQILNSEEFVKYKLTEKYKKASLAKLKDVQEGLLIGRANFEVTRDAPKKDVITLNGYLDPSTKTYK